MVSFCTPYFVIKALLQKEKRRLTAVSSFKLPFICFWKDSRVEHQGPVVQKVDNATNGINLSPVDDAIGFRNIYPLDSNLFAG